MSRNRLTRRRLLRGMVGGGAVALGLPLLDVFLNEGGTALAQGAPLPLRFGTWFWGCGMTPSRWVPTVVGPGYDLGPELQSMSGLESKVSILSGYDTILDGRPNWPHHTGVIGTLTGTVPVGEYDVPAPTLDRLVSSEIGRTTRFQSIEMSASGVREQSYSRESESVVHPSEVSPVELYTRIFGPEFRDPNDASFEPDPRTLLRQSVLSAVKDDAARLEGKLGSHDRQRLDQYFTSLRQLETQLEILLGDPPDLAACVRPDAPTEIAIGAEVGQALETHRVMADLLALALACDQTRVFNMMFSWGTSELRVPGENLTHHELTHDEPVDQRLGYQPRATVFVERSMEAWSYFLRALDSVQEGSGTLLDHCLVVGHSDSALAKAHEVTGLPIMIAGTAGGRLVSGLHVQGNGAPTTHVGLTVQQVFGLPVERWGTGSMEVSQPIFDVLV